MTMKTILRAAEKFVTDNSPGILTGLGIAGTITTAVLAAKGGVAAGLWLEQNDPGKLNNTKANIQETWRYYIPAAVSGAATVTCIIAANHIGTRRTAAIAAAFKLSEQLTEEYKERVVKTLGVKKEETLRSELAAERMERTGGSDVILIAGSESIFYDEMSGRFFKAEMENVRKAVNDINYKVNTFYCAPLSDFYELIGLERTAFSDSVGWNSDELLDVKYAATMLKDGRPAIAISFNSIPIHGFDRCQ